MRPIINGSINPIRTSIRQTYDPNKGFSTYQEYESAGDNLSGIAKACIDQSIPFDLVSNGKRSKISFTSSSNTGGGEEIYPDTWQLLGNEVQRDIREHPSVLALPAAPDGASLQSVQEEVKKFENGQTFDPDFGNEDANKLFQMLIRGVTSYSLGQYVLKHTTNVSDRYSLNVSDTGVERIYTTEQLIDEATNDEYWANPMPGRLVAKIQSLEVQDPSSDDVLWGWRKLPSQEVTAANNRIEISTEYWLAAWSRLLYAPK